MKNPNEIRAFANDLIVDIQSHIVGRIAHEHNNCNYLAWAVKEGGDGDHLEIGTLFGGSAILSALVKKEMGFKGNIICIDPLDGYYIGTQYEYKVDPVTGVPINAETVMENAKYFGVDDRIKIIKQSSFPWPEELVTKQFTSAFIDGDHWGVMPKHDWDFVHPRTNKIVVFDNYDSNHPSVVKACEDAAKHANWTKEFAAGITFIVRRTNNG